MKPFLSELEGVHEGYMSCSRNARSDVKKHHRNVRYDGYLAVEWDYAESL